MSTAIEWCHIPGYVPRTWNPVVGCTDNGTGCALCYARTLHNMRHKAYKEGKLQQFPQYAVPFSHVQLMPERLDLPLKTRKRTCWFVNSVSDLFHEEVPVWYIHNVFAVMSAKPRDIFIILTKRPQRMREIVNAMYADDRSFLAAPIVHDFPGRVIDAMNLHEQPLPNVWMGPSASTQAEVDQVVPEILNTNAAVRLLSLEPLVERVTIARGLPHEYIDALGHGYHGQDDPCVRCGVKTNALHWVSQARGLDWLILGGESGTAKQRPRVLHPDFATSVRDECAAADVAFFFKQWGAYLPQCQVRYQPKRRLHWEKKNAVEFPSPNTAGKMNTYYRVGKHTAGHLLDGEVHQNWPNVTRAVECATTT